MQRISDRRYRYTDSDQGDETAYDQAMPTSEAGGPASTGGLVNSPDLGVFEEGRQGPCGIVGSSRDTNLPQRPDSGFYVIR